MMMRILIMSVQENADAGSVINNAKKRLIKDARRVQRERGQSNTGRDKETVSSISDATRCMPVMRPPIHLEVRTANKGAGRLRALSMHGSTTPGISNRGGKDR
jgi:hypothetical protein